MYQMISSIEDMLKRGTIEEYDTVTDEIKEEIIRRFQERQSRDLIAREMGLNGVTVSRVVRNYQLEGEDG